MNIHYLQYIHMFVDFEKPLWKMSHQGYIYLIKNTEKQ